MKKFFSKFDEPFNGFSHALGALASVILLVILMKAAQYDPVRYKIAFVVYGIGLIGMFTSSALYHLIKASEKTKIRLQKFDHIMIFLMIAGSYTPIATIGLDSIKSYTILIIVWAIAAAGTVKKLYWINAPRWFSTAIYLVMGWIAVFIFPPLWNSMPAPFINGIIIGGLCYTVGAIIYATEFPNPFPGRFGHHEIWHLFVMGGAFTHFWAIYNYLPNAM